MRRFEPCEVVFLGSVRKSLSAVLRRVGGWTDGVGIDEEARKIIMICLAPFLDNLSGVRELGRQVS